MKTSSFQPIFCDLVVREDDCNLACSYCLTGQSNFKAGHTEQKIFQPPNQADLRAGTANGEALRSLIRRVADCGIPVLKLSGGEVLMHRGALDLVAYAGGLFETVVVLTNGSYLSVRMRAGLAEISNLVLQVSLDGVGHAASSYRTSSERVHGKLLERIEGAIEDGLVDEVYAVLHDRSIPEIEALLDWLQEFDKPPILLLFPERGPDSDGPLSDPATLEVLGRLSRRAASGEPALPNAGYFDSLINFARHGARQGNCHLPRVAFTLFDDGTATSCPNIWFERAGQWKEFDELIAQIAERPFRQLLLADTPRLPACRKCYTPWDPVTAYINGHIDMSVLAETPTYAGRRTRAGLKAMKVLRDAAAA